MCVCVWQVSEAKMLSRIPSSFLLVMFQRPTHLAIQTRTRTLQHNMYDIPLKSRAFVGGKCSVQGTALREHGEVDGGGRSLVSS